MVDSIPTRVEDRDAQVLRLLPTVRMYAARFCRNPETARDVAQEAMVRLLETFQPGKPRHDVKWIVFRVAYQVKRRVARRGERELDFCALDAEDRAYEPAVEDAPDERAAKHETVCRVRQAMRMLTPEERRAVRDGYINSRRVKSARSKLRDRLAARNMDAIAAEGTVAVEELIPMREASARLGLSRSSVAIPSTLVGTRRFVSARALRLFPRPAPRRRATADRRQLLPEPQPGRLWRVREVADLLGGFETKVLRLIASGCLPARKAMIAAGGFGARQVTVIDDADVRELYRSLGEK